MFRLKKRTKNAKNTRRDETLREYMRLVDDPNYHHIEANDKGGLKAIHAGHNTESLERDKKRYFGLTACELEQACQDELFRMGHRAILRDESKKQANGEIASCLDIELDHVIMDIASITEYNGFYGWRLMSKNSQIRRAREQTGDISDSVCLYFHDPALFHGDVLAKDFEWYRKYAPECGSEQRLHHIVVVIRGEREIRKYDI